MENVTSHKRFYGVTSVVIVLLLILLGSIYFLDHTLQPKDNVFREKSVALDSMRREYPGIVKWMDAAIQQHLISDTTIFVIDGTALHAIYVRASQRSQPRTALLIHGYKDCAVRMLHLGKMYHQDLGYNLLIPDLRYHGYSAGEYVGMGWADRQDLKLWLGVANNIFSVRLASPTDSLTVPSAPQPAKIVVHGVSMGAAATMMLAGENDMPSTVKAYIEDCGFISVWDEFGHVLNHDYCMPSFPFLHISSLVSKLRFGWGFREASALEAVKHSNKPMLFIHGSADSYVPTEMVHELYAAKPQPKSLWLVPNAKHAMSYHDHPVEYTHHVRAFLSKYM